MAKDEAGKTDKHQNIHISLDHVISCSHYPNWIIFEVFKYFKVLKYLEAWEWVIMT